MYRETRERRGQPAGGGNWLPFVESEKNDCLKNRIRKENEEMMN
jgi:hypothetical protein